MNIKFELLFEIDFFTWKLTNTSARSTIGAETISQRQIVLYGITNGPDKPASATNVTSRRRHKGNDCHQTHLSQLDTRQSPLATRCWQLGSQEFNAQWPPAGPPLHTTKKPRLELMFTKCISDGQHIAAVAGSLTPVRTSRAWGYSLIATPNCVIR